MRASPFLLATAMVFPAAGAPPGKPDLEAALNHTKTSRIEPREEKSAADPQAIRDWSRRIAALDAGSKNEAWARPDFDDRAWKEMVLPVHWENAGLPDYDGVVWFRRTIEVPAAMTRGEAVLSLGAIDDMDVTWVNGVWVGAHEQAGHHFTPRDYQLPAGTLKAGPNLLAVRVMDHGWGGGMAATHGKMQLTGGGQALDLTGPWKYRAGANLAQLIQMNREPRTSERPMPFKGSFELRDGDVIALAGGSGMVKQFESGYLETLLTASTRKRIYFRDIAWQADTVYRQQRPRNFGTHLDLLNRIHATVLAVNFGQMEALDGVTKLPAFLDAYESLLSQFEKRTLRIVLIAPRPFANPTNPHLPDLSNRNGDVAAYAEAIRQLAERRGFLFVDLAGFDPDRLTSDGLHLNEAGQVFWASAVASQLLNKKIAYEEAAMASLRSAITHKNILWRQHWRPTNWSFLYGNRQHVPSSHDHRPGQGRWFPKEIDAIIPMIEEAEEKIFNLRNKTK